MVGIVADPQKITIDRPGQFPHMITVRHQLSYEEMSRPINRTESLKAILKNYTLKYTKNSTFCTSLELINN